MYFREIFAALAAVVLFSAMVDTAQAYPIAARSGTTTVTGVYRPLNLDLALIDGSDSKFFFNPSDSTHKSFAFTGQLGGTFTSSYGASGTAGSWTLNLGFNTFNQNNYLAGTSNTPLLEDTLVDQLAGPNTIELKITANVRAVGTLVYNSGLSANIGTLPAGDTPRDGDMFLLYAHNSGVIATVTVADFDVSGPNSFELMLAQNLLQVGPYVAMSNDIHQYTLDTGNGQDLVSRVNTDCSPATNCSLPQSGLRMSSAAFVPEPASLVLVGVGLVALGLGRRRQRPRLR